MSIKLLAFVKKKSSYVELKQMIKFQNKDNFFPTFSPPRR